MAKKPIEEIYDDELLQALSDIETMVYMMRKYCHKRIPYEKWPHEYQIIDELVLITSIFRKTRDEEVDG